MASSSAGLSGGSSSIPSARAAPVPACDPLGGSHRGCAQCRRLRSAEVAPCLLSLNVPSSQPAAWNQSSFSAWRKIVLLPSRRPPCARGSTTNTIPSRPARALCFPLAEVGSTSPLAANSPIVARQAPRGWLSTAYERAGIHTRRSRRSDDHRRWLRHLDPPSPNDAPANTFRTHSATDAIRHAPRMQGPRTRHRPTPAAGP